MDTIIDLALVEDISHGDVTSEVLIHQACRARQPYWLKRRE